MSDPSNVGGGGAASQSGNAGKKPRSPVERIIVWGAIIVLLGVVAVEARARKGYEWTLNALQKQLAKDEGADAEPLLVKDIDKYVVGWPRRTESEEGSYHKITLTWGGLFRSHGIDLTYDSRDNGEGLAVLGLTTHGAEEPPPPVIPEGGSETEPGPVVPPEGYSYGSSTAPGAHNAESTASPGGGGGPGGGGRFDPMQQDTDGDGKISKDEAQGPFKERFDENDTNADGFIDQDEIAAMRERFRNRQGSGGPGGAGSGGRGRPEAESGSPPADGGGATDKPAEPTPSESTPAKEGTEAPAEADKTSGESAS